MGKGPGTRTGMDQHGQAWTSMDIGLILLSCQNFSLNPLCPVAMMNADLALGDPRGESLNKTWG